MNYTGRNIVNWKIRNWKNWKFENAIFENWKFGNSKLEIRNWKFENRKSVIRKLEIRVLGIGNGKQLDLGTEANGIYFLRVTANGQSFMQKVVKQD
jgi:hypothetical protein